LDRFNGFAKPPIPLYQVSIPFLKRWHMSPVRLSGAFSLVADIGGTNTRVALAEGDRLLVGTSRRYRNAEHSSLEAVLRRFLDDGGGVDCAGACIAVAGPVNDGVAELTNVDWRIDTGTLARASRAETVALLNDLQAQGHSLGQIGDGDLHGIIPSPGHDTVGTQLVIGVGTGFNIAPVHFTGSGRAVMPSEAGHASAPARTEADFRLMRFVETTRGFPAIEEILSGRGLETVYAWLGHEAGDPRDAKASDIISGFGSDPRSEPAMRTFARLLGAVAGDLALAHLPVGGIYLSGGVARAFAPHLVDLGFVEAFRSKGRFTGFMAKFGVTVIDDDYSALAGCAKHLSDIAPS